MNESATLSRAYRVRLRPKPAQARALNRLFGARRLVWNWALRRKDEAYRADGTKLSWVDLSREFTVLREAPDTAWLAQLPREPFNQTLRDFDRAWRNFFAGRARRPRRKRRGTVQSARFTLDQRRIDAMVEREAGTLTLPVIGRMRFRVSEPLNGRLRSVTISKDAAGRWLASFTADGIAMPEAAPAAREAVGIDLGLKDAAVLSDGEKVAASKHLTKRLAKLRRYQRHYTRQRNAAMVRAGLNPARPIPKGTRLPVSNRMRRTTRQIGTLHARIADARRDHQHQITARAVRLAAVVCIEDLNVKGMARGMGRRAFRRSVADAGMGEIRRQLTYKAGWHGRLVSAVGRFYPSSKTCSACGNVHAGLQMKDRTWECPKCGQVHDRDTNAAINIEREGLRLLAKSDTPRRGEINARGVDACAVGRSSPTGQPTTMNREPVYRAAKPRITHAPKSGTRRVA